LFNVIQELFRFTFGKNIKLAISNLYFKPTGCKGSAEDYLFGILRNIDEAAAASHTAFELTNVNIAVLIGLS